MRIYNWSQKEHGPKARYLHILFDRSSNEEGDDNDDEEGDLKLAETVRGGGKSKLDEGNGRDKQPFLARSALPKQQKKNQIKRHEDCNKKQNSIMPLTIFCWIKLVQ